MNTLKLEIVTPERVAYSETVDMVTVPSTTGTLGILPKHIPLFASLTEGELKIKKGNDEIFLAIGGGFIEVTKEKVMILVTRAVHAKELNEAEILKARKAAEESLKQKPTGRDLAAAQALMRQSLVDMHILSRRRNRTH